MRSLQLLLIAATIFLFSPKATAQPNALSFFGGQAVLTSYGRTGYLGGVAYQRRLTSWLALEAEGQFMSGDNSDRLNLLSLRRNWYRMTHMTAGANVVALPLRMQAFGAEHRFGLSGGLAFRYKDEDLQKTFISAGFLDQLAEGEGERITSEWEALGDGFRARWVYYEGNPEAEEAWLREPGTHLALTFPNEDFDPGWSLGLAYEAGWGRTVIGVRAIYRRYLDQKILTGSHALDVSLRVGYRF